MDRDAGSSNAPGRLTAVLLSEDGAERVEARVEEARVEEAGAWRGLFFLFFILVNNSISGRKKKTAIFV